MNLDNAVAVVGIACRFPGADSPEEYWEVLKNGENHIREVPDDRWNKKFYYSKDRSLAGKTFAIHAGILKEDVRLWDNKPFGINVMEAELMDPQQRLVLETSYRALEDGGFTLDEINDTSAAVYMGLMNNDFQSLAYMDPKFMDNYSPTGTTNSILSNRVSFFYNVHGPSVSVDTACSSGLVAVNLGSQSILSGESDMAMCGGVACILSPTTFIALSKARMASEVGQCQTYTENADGYVRSEGCGVVVLKNLKKALADGNKIWGVVTSACNSDGKATSPITAPSSKIQGELIQRTLQRAGVGAEQIQFVEMHGTGTPVGDPCETSAVGSVIGAAKRKHNLPAVPVGSVKTNIGHLEAGAGIAGLMKVLLMMKHGTMAPSVMFGPLKESLNLEQNYVHVVQQPTEWQPVMINGEELRLASVNSFGFGGTNVHLVAQSSDRYDQRALIGVEKSTGPQVVLFTGFDAVAMKGSMVDTYEYLEKHPDLAIDEISKTSTFHRTMYPNKAAVIATSVEDLRDKLKTIIDSSTDAGKRVSNKEKRKVIFVFCGMGTHWTNMGAQLYASEPDYRNTIDAIHDNFVSCGDFDLKGCLAGQFDLENPRFGQPSIFACQVALYELWKSKGVRPDVIVGHSVGEVAASYASGYLTLQDACYVIYERGRIVSKASDGGMLAVGNLPVEEVERLMKPYTGKLDIAAFNSPNSCTVSGELQALGNLEKKLDSLDPKPFLRRLAVSVAYHSSYMNPVLDEIVDVIDEKLKLSEFTQDGLITHVSTVSGDYAKQMDFRSGDYWARNVRRSVRFTEAMLAAIDKTCTNVIVEIGPKPALKTNIKEIASGSKFELFNSMTANKDDIFYTSLAKIYELGTFKQIKSTTVLTTVPRYAFQREMLYKEPEIATSLREGREIEQTAGQHPFVFGGKEQSVSVCKVSNETTRFVFEHRLDGNIIVPGATYAEMGIAAVSQVSQDDMHLDGQLHIKARVHFNQVCLLKNETSSSELKVACHQDTTNRNKYFFDVTAGETLHAAGQVLLKRGAHTIPQKLNLENINKTHTFRFDDNFFYDTLEKYGFTYGPSLRSIKGGSTDYKDCIVELQIPDGTDLRNTFIHPAVLDSLLQGGIMFPAESSIAVGGQILPYGVNEIVLYRPLTKHMFVYMKPAKSLDFTWEIDALVTDETGVVLAECKGITYGLVGKHLNYDVEQHMFTSSWKKLDFGDDEVKASEKGASRKRYVVFLEEGSQFPLASFRGKAHHIVLSTWDIEDISRDEEHLKSRLPENLNEYNAILYTIGFNKTKSLDKINGVDMNSSIQTATFTLLQLVKLVSKGKQPPPVFAVTRGVHSFLKHQQLTPGQEHNTIIGVTVNAMCRSVNKELSSFAMHSIDVNDTTKHDMAWIEFLISNKQSYFEFVINDQQVYYGTLDSAEQTGAAFGKIMCVSDSKVQVHYSAEEDTMILRPAPLPQMPKERFQLKIERVALESSTATHTKFTELSSKMRFVDGTGTTTENKRFHICQWQSMQSYVYPDRKSCIPWDLFPSEFPSMSFWLMAWKTMKPMKKGQSFFLQLHEVSSTWEIIAICMGRMLGLKQTQAESQAENIVVITKDLSISLKHPKARVLVICEEFDENTSKTNTDVVSKIVYKPSVLAASELSRLVPKFQMWLEVVSRKKLSKELKLFDQAMSGFSDILTISDFTNVTFALPKKSTFLKLERNGRPPYMVSTAPQEVIRPDSGYLLIGGRKGLGWETATYLINYGAKFIGVISRSGLEEEKIAEARELESKYNCKIIDLKADACEMNELQEAFETFKKLTNVPIRGIFYGAAVTCDSIIPAMTLDKFMLAISPKVCGVWNTYILSKHLPLDIFIMYSSITSTFGNAGQTNYGAGNAFKDAISCLRRMTTGVGQSICWGALDLGILVDNQNARKKVQQLGLAPMKISEILTSLDHALVSNQPVMAYVRFIWPSWYRYLWSGPEVLRTQYASLIKRYCHHLKRGKQAKELLGKAKNNQEYVVEVLKTVAVLSDEDISLEASMADLGADSQDRQKIYNVFVEDVGFNEKDMTLIEMGEMVLSELVKHMKNIKAKYGKEDSNETATAPSEDTTEPETVTATSHISTEEEKRSQNRHGNEHTMSTKLEDPKTVQNTIGSSRNISYTKQQNGSNIVPSTSHLNGHHTNGDLTRPSAPNGNYKENTPSMLSTQNGKDKFTSMPNLHQSSENSSPGKEEKKGMRKKFQAIFGGKKSTYAFETHI